MPKLTIRTIEIDLEPAAMPELIRGAIGAVMGGGQVNGHAIADIAEPLKLPAPAATGAAPKPLRKYKPRANPPSLPKPRLGRPPNAAAAAKPQGGRIIDRVEEVLGRYGWLSVSAIAQKIGCSESDLGRSLYHGVKGGRFKHDPDDQTYNLADPPAS